VESPALEHENAYQHPELLEQIAPELRVLVQDHISKTLLNHLGKEDSHLFPMASRLLTAEEKAAIAAELEQYEPERRLACATGIWARSNQLTS